MSRSRLVICAIVVFGLQGCSEKKQESSEQPVRGLREGGEWRNNPLLLDVGFENVPRYTLT